jgi:hypothetical protein
MPGAGFQRFAAKLRTANGPFTAKPWNVRATSQCGPRTDATKMRHQDRSRTEASMASRMLEESNKLEDKEKVALEAASNSYVAGVGWSDFSHCPR